MNISRKNFLVGAAATAITAPAVDGASLGGIGMAPSARARGLMGGAFMGTMMAQQGGKTYTCADYLQTNLKAMWDGIENDGRGVHNASATAWKEWVEGLVNPAIGSGTWTDNALDMTNGAFGFLRYRNTPSLARDFPQGQDVTVEFVCRCDTVSTASDSTRLFSIQANDNNNIITKNGWNGGLKLGIGVSWNSLRGFTGMVLGTTYSISCVFTFIEAGNYSEKMYVNGQYLKTTATTTAPYNDNSNYMLYASGGGTILHTTRWYGGKALTASEVAANYKVDKARFNLP